MKKIFTLFVLVLLSCMGAWAGSWSDQNQYPKVSGWNGKVIRMKAKWSDTTRPLIVSNGVVKTAVNEEDEAALFALVSNPCYDGSFNMCLASAGVSKGIQWKNATLGTSIRPVVFQQSTNYNNTTYFWHCANLTEVPTGGYSHGCYTFNNQDVSFNWYTKDGEANGYDYVFDQGVQAKGNYTTDFIVEEVVGYSAWKVIVDGNGTVTTSVTTTAQGNNGIVVVEGAVSESSFICSNGFAVTSIDSENKVVTIGQPKSPAALTSGWYQIKWVDVNNDSAAGMVTNDIAGKFVKNYATDVEVGGSKYPFYLDTANGVPATLDEAAKSYIYVDRASASVNTVAHIRSVNGHYAAINGQANVEPQNLYIIYFSSSNYPNNSVVCSSTTTSDRTRTSWAPYETDGVKYIRSGNQNKYSMVQFLPVNLESVGMIPYTVTIINGATDAQVTYTGSANYGIETVYNNGTLFFAKDASVTKEDFTAPNVDGYDYNVSVNSETSTITITYSLLTPDWDGLEAIVNEANSYPYGDGLGQYSNPDFGPAKIQAESVWSNHVGGFDAGRDQVAEAISTLRAEIDNLTLNMPTTGNFFRIRNYRGEGVKYLLGRNNGSEKMVVGENCDDAIFYYTGSKLIAYTTGRYVGYKTINNGGGNVNYGSLAAVGNEGASITISKETAADVEGKGCYKVQIQNDQLWLTDESTQADGSQGSRSGSGWTLRLEDVTTLPVTISAAGYATFNCPVAVTIPSGVRVYTGTINGNVLALSEVTDVIPANTPVVLKGAANTYNFPINNSNPDAIASSLVGTVAAQAVAASSVVTLQKLDDVVGFYTYEGTTLRGFSAYINGSAGSNFRIAFDEITGINAIDASIAGGAIYDLTGRRVNTIQKGQIYVKNGKKFMF